VVLVNEVQKGVKGFAQAAEGIGEMVFANNTADGFFFIAELISVFIFNKQCVV
jgi:hypothetical protein